MSSVIWIINNNRVNPEPGPNLVLCGCVAVSLTVFFLRGAYIYTYIINNFIVLVLFAMRVLKCSVICRTKYTICNMSHYPGGGTLLQKIF